MPESKRRDCWFKVNGTIVSCDKLLIRDGYSNTLFIRWCVDGIVYKRLVPNTTTIEYSNAHEPW